MNINDFDYDLPKELIAQKPIEPRNASRLMVLRPDEETIEHSRFWCLEQFLEGGDTLIFNDTRVMPARLFGKRKSGAKIEVFLLRRIEKDTWETLVKPGRKAPLGEVISFGETLSGTVEAITDFGGRIVTFRYDGIFEEILDFLGETPLPPYIHEKLDEKERYQTVYNKVQGSAAAPTAGLHFTQEQMESLKARGINLGFLTLHVGLGTFRPVQTENIEEHKMHSEYFSLPEETAKLVNDTKAKGHKVYAVGTTAIRTLEAAAQGETSLRGRSGQTDIFIYPGYKFRVVDGIITNFHLPKSTLIMLIAAFAGREFVLRAYKEAVKERYRFFSFGDAMLILGQGRKGMPT